MKQGPSSVISDLAPLIANKSLLLMSLGRIGAHFWLRLYHMIAADVVETIDIIFFDTADEVMFKEIKEERSLIIVTDMKFSENGPFGRSKLQLSFEQDGHDDVRTFFFRKYAHSQ